MEAEAARLPVKADVEVAEKSETREKKESKGTPWWTEKLLTPAFLVILTVALSGYVVPKALERSQQAQRVRDVTNQLLDEIALNTGEMKVAIESYSRAQTTYWTDAARVNAIFREYAVRRNIGAISADSYEKENALIENDRKRVFDRMDAAAVDYDHQLRKFRTWAIRTRVRIGTLYPDDNDRIRVQKLLDHIVDSAASAQHVFDDTDQLNDKALNGHIAAFKRLGANFEAKRITRAVYQEQATAVLDQLRYFKAVEGPGHDLNNAAVEEVTTTLRRMTPVP